MISFIHYIHSLVKSLLDMFLPGAVQCSAEQCCAAATTYTRSNTSPRFVFWNGSARALYYICEAYPSLYTDVFLFIIYIWMR
jgi:hypothetical protein